MCSNSAQRQVIVNQLERGVRLDVHLGIEQQPAPGDPVAVLCSMLHPRPSKQGGIHAELVLGFDATVTETSWRSTGPWPPTEKSMERCIQSIRSMMDIPGLYNGAMHL